jgi:beta-lactamase class D
MNIKIKKMVMVLGLGILVGVASEVRADCFLVQENGKIIERSGDCESRHSPCSTFKIAISLMGYNEGLLVDENNPELPFLAGYADGVAAWRQPHNPTSWMKNSCVWYSQFLTQKIGMTKFKNYVEEFQYGNQDVSGDKIGGKIGEKNNSKGGDKSLNKTSHKGSDAGLNNGLTRAWLSSSLQISPLEQTQFLQKLIDEKLPVSSQAQIMTKKILLVEELPSGWKLYGKTGAGDLKNSDGSINKTQQIGWFVGWIEKENRKIIFANYIEQPSQDYSGGKNAKALTRAKLLRLIAAEK